jgi:hypothetical protein
MHLVLNMFIFTRTLVTYKVYKVYKKRPSVKKCDCQPRIRIG